MSDGKTNKRGSSRRRSRATGLRKHQQVENVLVEEQPFALLGRSQEKAGEGVYVSATVAGSRRYYGVLIDQPALKEASQMWLQDQADSLQLNKRMKVMMLQQQQNTSDAVTGGVASAVPNAAAASSSRIGQTDDDGADGTAALAPSINGALGAEASSMKRPAEESSSTMVGNNSSNDDEWGSGKRPKLEDSSDKHGIVVSASTAAAATSTAAAATSVEQPDDAKSAPTIIDKSKSKPATFDEKDEDRPVQKFKYVWNKNSMVRQNGGQRRQQQQQHEDPGYRILVATFCSVKEAAGGDIFKARAIKSACEEGGNFLNDYDNNDEYYYQYEVLPTALQPAAQSLLSSELNELRTSMGMNCFFHNTSLPPWFPLSNLQIGQHKLLSMLSMKRDNSGKVTWDTNAPIMDTSISSSDAVAAVLARGGTKLPMQPRKRNEYRIGVIGGGIAGLSCCQHLITSLSKEGIDAHVTLMEARPRLGGRLFTERLPIGSDENGDNDKNNRKTIPLELGASWIHGIDDNPLAELAKQANIEFLTSSEEVQMLGKGMHRVDSKVDERMGKLFDTLLDHAAEDSWSVPETSVQSSSTPQTAVRWYSSVFVGHNNKNGEQQHQSQTQRLGVPPHRQSSDHSIDVEVGKAIGKHKLREFSKLSDIEHRMLLWNTKNVEYALGANISDLSMKFWDSDERHAFDGDHVLLKQGYSTVVDHVFAALQKEGKGKFECITNFPVGKVEYARKSTTQPYSKNRVQLGRDHQKFAELSDSCSVTSQDGSQTLYFDFLVCATPLGVLKESVQRAGTEDASDTLSFQPSLPFSKIDAITNVGFGLLDKVYIQFPTAFWRRHNLFNEDDQCLFGNVSGVNPHHYMFFDVGKCLAADEENPPAILMSLISGKEAVACERLSDNEMIDQVVATLRTIFSEHEVPAPTTFRITRWGRDKYARGSYTFLPPGATDQDFQLLQSPINGNGDSLWLDGAETMRLFFAGEHTTSLHPSMAHGAMLSGMRAAKELFASITLKNRDEKDVDKMIPVALFCHKNPSAPLQCSFCHKIGGQVREGSLVAFKRGARVVLAHDNCAENCPEVEVVDLKWKSVIKAVNRGKGLNCCLCGKSGATIGCTAENCFRLFHFSCAEDTAWRFERDGKVFYCDLHRRHLPNRSSLCDRISMKFFLTKMPTSLMSCGLCQSSEENMFFGSLVAFSDGHKQQICVHTNCMKYTNIVDPGEVEGSRIGQEYSNVFIAIAQSKYCHSCKRAGATIVCSEPSCESTFHLPCTRNSGWNFEKQGTGFRCEKHRAGRLHDRKVQEKVEPVVPVAAAGDGGAGRLDGQKVEETEPMTTNGAAAGGSFQHNLLNLFGGISTSKNAPRTSNPSNLDMGGTAAPSPPSPGSDDGIEDESDSEDSFPVSDGNALEVIDARLIGEMVGSKQLVRIERLSRNNFWNVSFKVIVVGKSRYLSVASVSSSSGKHDIFSLSVGDIVISMDGKKIGSPASSLQCIRDVLSLMKEKVDIMLEVVRT